MPINITPLNTKNPTLISEDEYQALLQTKELGWTNCQSLNEYLAKLHYVRLGVADNKIDQAKFQELVKKLTLAWMKSTRSNTKF